MRRILLLATVGVMILTSVVHAQSAVFRGLMWGDSPSVLGETVVVSAEGLEKILERRDEDYSLGSVTAFVIRYGFFDNRLFQISVGTLDGERLEELVFARYSRPTRQIRGTYFSELPDEDTIVTFTRESDFAIMVLASMSLMTELISWQEAQKEAEARSAW